MTVHPVTEAFPHNTTVSDDTIRQKLGSSFPLVLLAPGDITSMNFSQSNAVAVPNAIVAKISGIATLFLYDAADSSTSHNGTSVLVSSDGKRYKSTLAPAYFVNVLSRTNTPPGSPATGDRYIVGSAPSGDWASNADDLTVFDGQDWVFVSPEIGQTVYVRDVEGQMHWGESGAWVEGAGSFSVEAASIGARELEFPWGMVVESEIAIPPGTRVASGVTPTMPLGGTASNINDNNGATSSTTSSLGDLSAAALTGRIVAQLDLGSVKALAAIEATQLKRSSSSNAGWGLYYSSDGSTYTLLGSTFTVTATEADFTRSGTFNARYVALVAPQANYSTVTATLDDLNAYAQATTIADGTKYIVAANGVGVFSGQDTKVAEARDGAFVFYTPYDGALVLNRATRAQLRYDSGTGAWISAGGVWVKKSGPVQTTSGSTSTGGTGDYSLSGTPPTTSLGYRKDDASITHQANVADAYLRFTYIATVAGAGEWTCALFRDSEVNAIAWAGAPNGTIETKTFSFLVLAPDALPHTYHIRFMQTGTAVPSALTLRSFMVEEASG